MHKAFLHTQIACCKKISIITWPPTMILKKKSVFCTTQQILFRNHICNYRLVYKMCIKNRNPFSKKNPKTFKYLGTSGFGLGFFIQINCNGRVQFSKWLPSFQHRPSLVPVSLCSVLCFHSQLHPCYQPHQSHEHPSGHDVRNYHIWKIWRDVNDCADFIGYSGSVSYLHTVRTTDKCVQIDVQQGLTPSHDHLWTGLCRRHFSKLSFTDIFFRYLTYTFIRELHKYQTRCIIF